LLQTTIDQRPGNATALSATFPSVQPPRVFSHDIVHDGPPPPAATVLTAGRSPSDAEQGRDWFHMHDVVAEYIAMTLFVTVGCGTAMGIAKEPGSAWVLQVALAFGFAITVLAYSLGRYSGGQINCAVTLALWVYGSIGWRQALFNFIAQMLGSVTGAILLSMIFPRQQDKTGALGSNGIQEGYHTFGVLLGEFIMTFVLVIVVFESGRVAGPGSAIAVICIGLAVFLAHCVLIPIDGCSINPTRSFGPALVAKLIGSKESGNTFKDMWVFWVGPLLGALAAAGVHRLFQT